MNKKLLVVAALMSLLGGGVVAAPIDAPELPPTLRINEIQVLGTHNS